jgi:hypothetical protein
LKTARSKFFAREINRLVRATFYRNAAVTRAASVEPRPDLPPTPAFRPRVAIRTSDWVSTLANEKRWPIREGLLSLAIDAAFVSLLRGACAPC